MKPIIIFFFGLLSLYGFSQSEDFTVEKTQLTDDHVLVTVTGPFGNYSTWLCKGNVDEVNTAVFKDGDMVINQNDRDHFVENIDLGLLPSDIEYFNRNNENMLVYGGNKLKILDGDTHENIIDEIAIDTKVSLFNGAFMPVSPTRNQITQNSIMHGDTERHFIICAGEGGGLTLIESEEENEFEIADSFIDDNADDKQLLSSSVHHYLNTSFYWALNYWDGTYKVKKYIWNSIEGSYEMDAEIAGGSNEIIELQAWETPGEIRIALLDRVLIVDPVTLNEINTYNDLSIDKFAHAFGHIKGEHKIYNFETNTYHESEEVITMATGGAFDWDNDRVYFTGYFDDEVNPEFRVINYKPGSQVQYYSLDGAMDVVYNSSPDFQTGDARVVAVGNDQIMGFDDNGYEICSSDLDCHYGYRIALDANPTTSPPYDDRIGISVACLNDGLLVQRGGYSCSAPPVTLTAKIVETGISSSLTCFHQDDEEAYFFYNGEGGTNIYYTYHETSTEAVPIAIGDDLSVSVVDCIYNAASNLVLAILHSNCEDGYFQLLEINDGNPVVSTDHYINISPLINYNEYTYCYLQSISQTHYVYRIWKENSIINDEFIQVSYNVNALEINKDDHLIYGICVIDGQNGKVVEIDHPGNNNLSYPIINNYNPVDISHIAGLDKVYIAQYDDKIIEVRNTEFDPLAYITINGNPKTIEYNPYQKQAYIMSEDAGEPGFTRITIIDCMTDQVLKEELIRKSDGFIYDTINDQLYLHTNCPYTNENGEFEYNIKALNAFNDEFSNQVNTNLYTYSDIFLSKDRTVPSKPSFDYANNYIYVGNYGASAATKIKAYEEEFTYRPGWNWLSFPRLERYMDEYFNSVNLLSRNSPFPDDELSLEYRLPGDPPVFIYKNWEQELLWYGVLDEISSSLGYKLYLDNSSPLYSLRLEGAKLDYDTKIDLVEGENWVGYFLDESYYPEQCLPPDLWEVLDQIKTQYWTMTKKPFSDPPWFIEGKKTPFRYGDLLILKTNHVYQNFQWQQAGDPQEDSELPQSSFFTFEEQADYIPFYVETDSTSDIQEIAVLADGEVKGAAVREPGDTLVEVNGYLQGVAPGALIEFETWNGTKSSPVKKDGYVVIDHYKALREKRNIYAGEKASYHHVSLKSQEIYELPPDISLLSCKPNPFKQEIEFSFRMNYENHISLEIYDMGGNIIKTIIQGKYPEGNYSFSWQGKNEAGNKIKPGVYFYKLNTNNGTVLTDKLVLIK
ncbi:MAG: T9SS type A sorting domain-containing protein [Bacteroidales bacterium]|nr:T9SS type A sorting domain-containing protein [Bacteroidales bacterium]MCF8403719.1 T9SS type A sorting domain-containing protein [Bacteroidales bacterium]